jgi:hypothetical protein
MIPFLKNRMSSTLVIVALAQTGVLAGMVVDRVRLLKTAARSPCRSCRSIRATCSAGNTCASATTSAVSL